MGSSRLESLSEGFSSLVLSPFQMAFCSSKPEARALSREGLSFQDSRTDFSQVPGLLWGGRGGEGQEGCVGKLVRLTSEPWSLPSPSPKPQTLWQQENPCSSDQAQLCNLALGSS